MARLISEVGKQADIMASADFKVIDNNLIPDFAEWNIRFASNQLALLHRQQPVCQGNHQRQLVCKSY